MRLALAQLNSTVGDVAGNMELLAEAAEQARSDGADVLVGPELGLIGYPPRDLLQRAGVVEACQRAVEQLARRFPDLTLVVGHPRWGGGPAGKLRNSASVCTGGRVAAVYDKRLLPGYDVFDEDRYFEPGGGACVIEIAGRRLGILICEDLWRAEDAATQRRYDTDPVADAIAAGADALALLNATHFVGGKWQRHLQLLRQAAMRHGVPIAAVHTVGANDDLIYDGRSVAVGADGSVLAVLAGWRPAVATIDVPQGAGGGGPVDGDVDVEPMSEIFRALALGVADYTRKTGNQGVIIGLSGGIDSSVTACVAAAALGPEHVVGVMMPSRYSSAGSIEDAVELAANLRLSACEEVPIEQVHAAVAGTLSASLGDAAGGVTDENIQARIRGVLLMAVSNAHPGSLVLVPSNKSEIATGYCTIYGDMCGALGVLGDLVKTKVYALAQWINANHLRCGFSRPPIPQRCLTKPPSAELRPNQVDQDTLPPYEIVDQIVERYIEREQSVEQIIEETGVAADVVREMALMIDRAQYKRDQAAIILKLTARAFGPGRPMPVAMRWRAVRRLEGTEARRHEGTK